MNNHHHHYPQSPHQQRRHHHQHQQQQRHHHQHVNHHQHNDDDQYRQMASTLVDNLLAKAIVKASQELAFAHCRDLVQHQQSQSDSRRSSQQSSMMRTMENSANMVDMNGNNNEVCLCVCSACYMLIWVQLGKKLSYLYECRIRLRFKSIWWDRERRVRSKSPTLRYRRFRLNNINLRFNMMPIQCVTWRIIVPIQVWTMV